jgi:transcriptional regulator with XRE-family HTH domain
MSKKKASLAAIRLKQARIMTGLSRNAFQKKTGISCNSLRAWEAGINSLKPQLAYSLSLALEKCGVVCSPEWLLDAEGDEPHLRKKTSDVVANSLELLNIQREISAFKLGNKNAIVQIVSDDLMLPFFSKGDYVGGYDFQKISDVHRFQSKFCIVELDSGETIVRNLVYDKQNSKLGLIALNPSCFEHELFYLTAVKIKKISEIIWHRKG